MALLVADVVLACSAVSSSKVNHAVTVGAAPECRLGHHALGAGADRLEPQRRPGAAIAALKKNQKVTGNFVADATRRQAQRGDRFSARSAHTR